MTWKQQSNSMNSTHRVERRGYCGAEKQVAMSTLHICDCATQSKNKNCVLSLDNMQHDSKVLTIQTQGPEIDLQNPYKKY